MHATSITFSRACDALNSKGVHYGSGLHLSEYEHGVALNSAQYVRGQLPSAFVVSFSVSSPVHSTSTVFERDPDLCFGYDMCSF
jgi:hypothetical protein